jgi:hypothetical protein
MLKTVKPLILWLDARFTRLWNEAVRRKDIFIHGEFTYRGFIKDNVHLFALDVRDHSIGNPLGRHQLQRQR